MKEFGTAGAALALMLATVGGAYAQADMSCADLMKTNAQMDQATKDAMAKDADAMAMNQKVDDYCRKNPTARASEAMEKALGN